MVVLQAAKRFHVRIAMLDLVDSRLEIAKSMGAELTISRRRFPEVLEWLKNGEVDPSRIITHTFPFAEIQRAMDLIDQKPFEVCKVLLTF